MRRSVFLLFTFTLVPIASLSAPHRRAFAEGLTPGKYYAPHDSGELSITPVDGGKLKLSIFAEGANGHTCEVESEIPADKMEVRVPVETFDPPPANRKVCIIQFVPLPKGYNVVVPPASEEACRNFCGARASFYGEYKAREPMCLPKAVRATRAKFKKSYQAKNYEAARSILSPILDRCADNLASETDVYVRNDLALTLHHLTDDAGCLRVLAPHKDLALSTEAKVREMFATEPSAVDEWVRIARATQTNWNLCSAQETAGGTPAQLAAPTPIIQPILLGGGLMIAAVADRRWIKFEKLPRTIKGKPAGEDCGSDKEICRVELGRVKGGESYRLFSATGELGTGVGTRIAYSVDGYANESFKVDIKPASKGAKGWHFAVRGDWNVLPRLAKKEQSQWVVDLDGDGKDETIRLVMKKGKSDNGEPVKLAVYSLEMNGRKYRLTSPELDGTYQKEVNLEFADLNGDGVLDLLFSVLGHNTHLFIMDVAGGNPVTVASFYSGD
jgi:hypothetical protein